MSPDHLETFQFSGRQQLIHASLVEKGQGLADLYEASLRVYSDRRNPARIMLAAHSMRELVGNLPRAFDLPIPADPGKITEQINGLELVWDSAIESECHKDGEWKGQIDSPLQTLLKGLHYFFDWLRQNRPKHRDLVTQMFRGADPSDVALPENLEGIRVNQWIALRRYFNNSAHGNRTTEGDFEANVDALEKILLNCLNPQPSEDLSAIDQILAEGATDA